MSASGFAARAQSAGDKNDKTATSGDTGLVANKENTASVKGQNDGK